MFTLQLHIPLNSPMGRQIGLIQHLVVTAVANGIRNIPGYKVGKIIKKIFLFN